MKSARDRLIEILDERSVKRGSFTLSSGAKSDYYIDARRTTMCGEGLKLIGQLGLGAIRNAGWDVTVVGGMTLGADPVSYAIAAASQDDDWPIDAFTVRKQVKEHGTGRRIEGCLEDGDRVALVEDVITTGGSALQAAKAVQSAGGTIVGVLAIVDREEGGREAIAEAGFQLITVVSLADLGLQARNR